MTTITEDYCSYEVAKLLKEKGFNEPCDNYYDKKGSEKQEPQELTWNEIMYSYNEFLKAPTHQMAMKWLREVHGLIISIEFQIICPTWKWRIYIKSSNDKHTDFRHYNKYEDAVEKALKYTVENLI
jgi:hypothetical protein